MIAQLHHLLGPEFTYLCQQGPPGDTVCLWCFGRLIGHEFYVGCKSWTNVLQVTHRHCATYGYGKWKYGTTDSCVSSTSPGSHCCSPFWTRCSHSCWASGMDSDISHSALIWRCTQCIKVTLSCWLKRWSSSSCNWLSSCSRSTIQHWFNAAQCLWWYHWGSRTGGTDNILLLGIELYGYGSKLGTPTIGWLVLN